jgi:asparagine synthase (glutamine-hydrolysing)
MIRWKGFKRLEIEELCREAVSLEHTQFYRTFARFPRRAHLQRYSAVMACLPGERLTQAQRLTGAAIRYPFCEPSTWRFLCQLPPEFRHVPGESKRILRAVLARYVPREIWDFPKHTFDFPLQTFLSNDDFALVRRHVLDGRWLERGLLDFRVVQRYAQQYMAGEQRLMFRVWALVVLGAWLDAHEWVD